MDIIQILKHKNCPKFFMATPPVFSAIKAALKKEGYNFPDVFAIHFDNVSIERGSRTTDEFTIHLFNCLLNVK